MLPPSLALFLAFALITVGYWLIKASRKALIGPLNRIPGPRLNRFNNLPLKFHVLLGRRLHYIHHLHEVYGPVVRISPNEVAISDLAATKEIHRIGSGYLKAEWYLKFTDAEAPGIFAMIDPKMHAARRKLFSNAFSQNGLLFWEELLQERTSLAVEKMKREASGRGGADILKWWTFMATDVIAELGFGKGLSTLENGQKSSFSNDLETVMIFSGLRTELSPLTSIIYYIPLPSVKHWLNSATRIRSYGTAAIQRSKALAEKGQSRGTIFSKMISEAESGTSLISETQVEHEASNLIVAGSDTTAVTLTYLVWAVLKHPSVKQRLLDEISNLPPRFSSKDASALPYLGMVIKETLRLYGAAPGSLPRVVPHGGRTLAAYFIPERTIVSTQAYTLHRDGRIFEQPWEFRPERWLEPTQNMKDAYMPWGGGSRICIGMHLALLELSLGAAKFFRECPGAKITSEDKDMEFENHFLIAPASHKCEIVF